jgi:hypothetical protein
MTGEPVVFSALRSPLLTPVVHIGGRDPTDRLCTCVLCVPAAAGSCQRSGQQQRTQQCVAVQLSSAQCGCSSRRDSIRVWRRCGCATVQRQSACSLGATAADSSGQFLITIDCYSLDVAHTQLTRAGPTQFDAIDHPIFALAIGLAQCAMLMPPGEFQASHYLRFSIVGAQVLCRKLACRQACVSCCGVACGVL